MPDLQALADRVEIAALSGEFTDAGMMRDFDRLAALFTADGVLRIQHIVLAGRDEIRASIEQLRANWEFFVQNAHPGAVTIDGDTASGRSYIHEFGRFRDGSSHSNYSLYHDEYRRTPNGWRFSERVYEMRYVDTTALPGSAA
ncbi:nuclear transport factor 2 family protein [Kutzneria kofuensis]|uniref:Ketosteroid isomerase-like protein n=1 Tax=Kutzneria kofuensis TaxID=103725 RepID=A0A7W9NFH0_9PSEU|nr:nuclear transport factor 2 family protein [Kutzneria kofuensis]MBB5890003.1 ketosteroid isomerase-like protein [Kutzneria kofuensis]